MCIISLFRKKEIPFDPEKNGYMVSFRETFKSGVNWLLWDHREPWSGDNDTKKENTRWTKDQVKVDRDGCHLIATRNGTENICGLISSHKFLNFRYGYVEVEAKMPPMGFKFFPAIWMYNKQGWLPEIDIVELMGEDSTRATFTHHWLNDIGEHKSKGKGYDLSFDLSKGFHMYAVEWTQTQIRWFIDGIEYFSTAKNIPQCNLFLIANIQAGDPAFMRLYQPGEYPQEMLLKKITIYQKP